MTEYKGISITEDYTVSERQMTKEFANKAKEKNSLELEVSDFVWRNRGTPKSGLVLKWFTKVKVQQITIEYNSSSGKHDKNLPKKEKTSFET